METPEPPPITRRAANRSVATRVRAAVLQHGCLISNQPMPLELAHILPFSTDDDILNRLEHTLGFEPYTLSVNDEGNLVALRPDHHTLYDRGAWMLLPARSVLNRICATWGVELYDHRRQWINALDYKPRGLAHRGISRLSVNEPLGNTYRFVPCDNYGKVPIVRQIPFEDDLDDFADNEPRGETEAYWFPFEGFPLLTTHIRVEFVIANIGLKLTKLSRQGCEQLLGAIGAYPGGQNLRYDIELAFRIWKRWTTGTPAHFIADCEARARNTAIALDPEGTTANHAHTPGLLGDPFYHGPHTTPNSAYNSPPGSSPAASSSTSQPRSRRDRSHAPSPSSPAQYASASQHGSSPAQYASSSQYGSSPARYPSSPLAARGSHHAQGHYSSEYDSSEYDSSEDEVETDDPSEPTTPRQRYFHS